MNRKKLEKIWFLGQVYLSQAHQFGKVSMAPACFFVAPFISPFSPFSFLDSNESILYQLFFV
jgi:hypothetical protein